MTWLITGEEMIDIIEARIAQGLLPDSAGGVGTDSRTLMRGNWFVALRGKNFDGHDFIGAAHSAGAIGCIVEERSSYPIGDTSFPLLAVWDTQLALAKLARRKLASLSPRTIVIAGEQTAGVSRLCQHISRCLKERQPRISEPGSKTVRITLGSRGANSFLQELIDIEDRLDFLVVDLVPDSIEEIEAVSPALLSEICVLSGKPFAYLRLCAQEKDIEKATYSILSGLDKNDGLVLTVGQSGYALASRMLVSGTKLVSYESRSLVDSNANLQDLSSLSIADTDLDTDLDTSNEMENEANLGQKPDKRGFLQVIDPEQLNFSPDAPDLLGPDCHNEHSSVGIRALTDTEQWIVGECLSRFVSEQ